MTSAEQYLQKRCQRQEQQLRVLLYQGETIIGQLQNEIETLTSLACAFAFDLGAGGTPESVARHWDDAVRAAIEAEENERVK